MRFLPRCRNTGTARCVTLWAEALESGTSAVGAEPARLGARLPHKRLT